MNTTSDHSKNSPPTQINDFISQRPSQIHNERDLRVRPDLTATPLYRADPRLTAAILDSLNYEDDDRRRDAISAFDEAIERSAFECEGCFGQADLVVIGWRSWLCHKCFLHEMKECEDDGPSEP